MRIQKMKRNFADDERGATIVEKLYKKSQECYASAGGFMEDDDEEEARRERIAEYKQKRVDAEVAAARLNAPDDCSLCKKPLLDSFLWEKFSYPACDACRDDKGAHKLIARTEAKEKYMLKDCDLDIRKPVLRYISKKNPHNPRYGEMKLYLKSQLEERCLEIYGTWDNFKAIKEKKTAQKEERVEKRFEKKIKEMRSLVRGPKGPRVQRSKLHVHNFDVEMYDEERDEYKKKCKECGYEMFYEKL
uniref:XPA_C domain-containing protein n=1 Tax=Syphacia muris TaxID=451379 RepID=A0A0N5AN31_9BILA